VSMEASEQQAEHESYSGSQMEKAKGRKRTDSSADNSRLTSSKKKAKKEVSAVTSNLKEVRIKFIFEITLHYFLFYGRFNVR